MAIKRRLRITKSTPGGQPGRTIDGATQRTSKGYPVAKWSLEGPLKMVGLRAKRLACVGAGTKKHPCRSELDFVTPEDVEEHGLPPGTIAVIRHCVKKGSYGTMTPVASVREAMRAGESYCACVKQEGSARACMKKRRSGR